MVDVAFPSFGPLDLSDDPQETAFAGSPDLLNVDFDDAGRLRSRSGTTVLGTGTGTYLECLARHSDSRLLADGFGGTQKLYAFDLTGTELTSLSHSGVMRGYASIGTPTATYTYVVFGSGVNAIRYDGTTLSSIAAISGWKACGVTPWDNRLVVGCSSTNTSRVQFSDPGAPETFGVNNWVDLLPGDGEQVLAITSWRGMLFVFKATKFFVFYGTDTDPQGEPIFRYRTVDTGTGLRESGRAFQNVIATDNGVYFVGYDGIYRTTGDAPVLATPSLSPVFRGRTNALYSGVKFPTAHPSNWEVALGYHRRRLYVSCFDSFALTGNTFVVDPANNQTTMFDTVAETFAAVNIASGYTPRLYYVNRYVADAKIRYFDDSATDDAGTAIAAKYRTGFWTPTQGVVRATDGQRALRALYMDGTGSVTVKTAVSDSATLGSGATVTLGTSPAVARGWDWRGTRGRNFSVEISGTAPWSVSQLGARVV